MPVYTYRREDGTTFDFRQKFLDDPLETCPATGQVVNRVIHPAGIIFKGSGFYVNDAKKPSNSASPTTANGEKKPTGDGEKSETKSDRKTEAKAEAKPVASSTPAAGE